MKPQGWTLWVVAMSSGGVPFEFPLRDTGQVQTVLALSASVAQVALMYKQTSFEIILKSSQGLGLVDPW